MGMESVETDDVVRHAARVQKAIHAVWDWYHTDASQTQPTPPNVTMAIGLLSGAAMSWREHLLNREAGDAP